MKLNSSPACRDDQKIVTQISTRDFHNSTRETMGNFLPSVKQGIKVRIN